MSDLYLPQHGLNIERSSLPQIKSTDLPDFINWLANKKQVTSTTTEVPVASLYPTQGEYNETKIRQFMSKGSDALKERPILISGDYYIVDGHHRVIALLNLDKNDYVPVIQVHMNVADVLAAAKEYPKSNTKPLLEDFKTKMKDKHKVIAFGRMNPPTTGHAKLVDKVHEVAEKNHADHEIILSHSQDEKKNPLSQAQKIEHAKKFFPKTNITGSTKEAPTIFHHAEKAYKRGVTHLHVVMGSDRVKEFKDALTKNNGKFDKDGHGYQFKSITIHSAGERDPDAEGTEGMSASKMREAAKGDDFESFKKGVPSHVSDKQAKGLYRDVRKGMGIMNESIMLSEAVQDAGIFKSVFLTGPAGSGKDFVMKKALNGHGLTEIPHDKIHSLLKGKDESSPKSVDGLRHSMALKGRNGFIINASGDDHKRVLDTKKKLEDLGYDTKMVFVDVSDDVSRKRSVERGQSGGRVVPEKQRAEKWRSAQDGRVAFSKAFGLSNYHEINNDEDLRTNLDPTVHEQKGKELIDLHKKIKKFTQDPPTHPAAQEWIKSRLVDLAKRPVGNAKQRESVLQPNENSSAAQSAMDMGLEYFGQGRYGKQGKVTHLSLHDKLIDKKKILDDYKKDMEKKKSEEAKEKVGSWPLKKESLDHEFSALLLTESEPTFDTGEEGGPILGMDKTPEEGLRNGKATTIKKSFQAFRKENK